METCLYTKREMSSSPLQQAALDSADSADEQRIIRLFEDGDRALMSADAEALNRIYADDYQQSDEFGAITTKQDLIGKLTSGSIRFLSMISTGRRIRLFGNFAIVHGSEQDEIENSGQRLTVSYVYMDVVVRRNAGWQIVASQLVRVEA
jgi:ketosteroid isomerase-like protein